MLGNDQFGQMASFPVFPVIGLGHDDGRKVPVAQGHDLHQHLVAVAGIQLRPQVVQYQQVPLA